MISAPPQNPSCGQNFARRGESASSHLWTGLVGAWHPPLGPTGEKWFDQSGYRNDGTLTNMDPATDWVMTEKGWALDFDGSNDYVLASQNPPSCLSQITIRWKGYVQPVGVGDNTGRLIDWFPAPSLYRRGTPPNVLGWYSKINGVTRDYAISTSTITSRDIDIVVTFDGISTKVYLDGLLDKTQSTYAGVLSVPTNIFCICGRSTGTDRCLAARVNAVGLWNRVLSPAEIMQLYLDPAALFRKPHHYRCLDGLPAVSDRVGRGVLTGGRM